MLDIQKIIDKITRIKKLKIKTFEIIFDELEEVISELLDMKEEIELNIDLSGNGSQSTDTSNVDFTLSNDGANQSQEIKLDFYTEPVKN